METIKLTREENFLQGLDQYGQGITNPTQLATAYQAVCEAIYRNYGENAIYVINDRINPKFRELTRSVSRKDRTEEVKAIISRLREA